MDTDDHPQLARWGGALRLQAQLAGALGTLMLVIWIFSGHGYFWPRWVWMALAIPLSLQAGIRWAIRTTRGRRLALRIHEVVAGVIGALQIVIWTFSGFGLFWPIWPILALSITVIAHAWMSHGADGLRERQLQERVNVLTRTRTGALDTQAAELRRIERDLHDGAQARMVSLGMSLGMAEELVRGDPAQRDPDKVAALLAEARNTTMAALDDMRTVMRGIQPPVLVDRGLVGAVEALALDLVVPVAVRADLAGRPPAPVESAVYFAVAECLANVVKHSGATTAWVILVHDHGTLAVVVGDDGSGGALIERGTGLVGVARRLEAFDGTMAVESPPGGPTSITLEVPCELSSPKTMPSSETG